MSKSGTPEGLLARDVIRVKLSGRGLGRKVVVQRCEHETETVGVHYLTVIGGGSQLGESPGWTSMPKGIRVPKLGVWRGALEGGARGYMEITNEDGTTVPERGAKVATATRGAKRGAKKGGAKASSKAKANGGTKRASNEELDKLAARVVSLRDDKGKSWGEIEETLDIAPGRLRSLYNRGGGEAKGQRKGAAKSEGSKGSAKKGKRSRSRRGADPSDED